MVTMIALQQGVARFMDRDILPHLTGFEKVIVGGGAGLIAAKLPQIISEIPLLSTLSLYDAERDMIDVDAIYAAAKPYIGAEPLSVKVPVAGVTLKLSQREIDDLCKYIKEG